MTFARCDRDRRLLEREVVLLRAADEDRRRTAHAGTRPSRCPSRFAIAEREAYSKPVRFLIVVPDARPFQKPGAGRSKPTMSFPACFVGGESLRRRGGRGYAHSAERSGDRGRSHDISPCRWHEAANLAVHYRDHPQRARVSFGRDRGVPKHRRHARAARRVRRRAAGLRRIGDPRRADPPGLRNRGGARAARES